MDTELEDKLFHKYRSIFAQKDKPMTETAMCWGLQCGNGWYNIIDTLCGLIEHALARAKEDVERYTELLKDQSLNVYSKEAYTASLRRAQDFPQIIQAVQVKEKFGTLRFYTDNWHPVTDAYISFAENMSAITCEVCGNPGTINDGGWLKVRCEKHKED